MQSGLEVWLLAFTGLLAALLTLGFLLRLTWLAIRGRVRIERQRQALLVDDLASAAMERAHCDFVAAFLCSPAALLFVNALRCFRCTEQHALPSAPLELIDKALAHGLTGLTWAEYTSLLDDGAALLTIAQRVHQHGNNAAWERAFSVNIEMAMRMPAAEWLEKSRAAVLEGLRLKNFSEDRNDD